jgi:hypothetical protein
MVTQYIDKWPDEQWKHWPKTIDVLVSRAGPDKQIAQWIAKELESDGYAVILQDWDFEPGDNFILNMHEALRRGASVIDCVSADYLKSRYCALEWSPAVRAGKLIPVKVAPCEPDGVLAAYVYVDLFRLSDSARRGTIRSLVERGPPQRPDKITSISIWQLPIHNLEYWDVDKFTGRNLEIEQLAAGLWSGSPTAITNAAIYGLGGIGGIGKSALAREYARRFRDHYDYIWWIPSESEETLVNVLADLGKKLDPSLFDSNRPDLPKLARHALAAAARDSHPWLLIYDNCEDPLLFKRWRPNARAHCLVTSRLQDRPGDINKINLELLAPEAALELLLELSERPPTPAAPALVQALGYLPVAITHAGGFLRQNSFLSFEAYKQRLDGYINRLPRWSDYPFPAAATFSAAIDKIIRWTHRRPFVGWVLCLL